MGWTITDLHRNRMTLEQAKRNHVERAGKYCEPNVGEVIAHEWQRETFYAIVKVTRPNQNPVTFLRVDMIEQTPASFGYKDMSEEMGPYVADRPSRAFAALVYKHIPEATGYAKEFRERAGIRYKTTAQGDLLASATA